MSTSFSLVPGFEQAVQPVSQPTDSQGLAAARRMVDQVLAANVA